MVGGIGVLGPTVRIVVYAIEPDTGPVINLDRPLVVRTALGILRSLRCAMAAMTVQVWYDK